MEDGVNVIIRRISYDLIKQPNHARAIKEFGDVFLPFNIVTLIERALRSGA